MNDLLFSPCVGLESLSLKLIFGLAPALVALVLPIVTSLSKIQTSRNYRLPLYKLTLPSYFVLHFYVQVFQIDTTNAVTSKFPELVYARIVRITCLTANFMTAMRFEILGCKHD